MSLRDVSTGALVLMGLLCSSNALATESGDDENKHAAIKQKCADTFLEAQTLRDGGQLIKARDQFRLCSEPQCPGIVIKECSKGLELLQNRIPKLTFRVRDKNNSETTQARIFIDEREVLSTVSGQAIEVGLGERQVRAELADGEKKSMRIVVQEGERRLIEIDFAPVPAVTTTQAPAAPPESRSISPLAYIGFGLGGAATIAGAITGGLALGAASDLRKQCEQSGCAQSDIDDEALISHVSTAMFVVAGAGFALGVGGLLLPDDNEDHARRWEAVISPNWVGLKTRF